MYCTVAFAALRKCTGNVGLLYVSRGVLLIKVSQQHHSTNTNDQRRHCTMRRAIDQPQQSRDWSGVNKAHTPCTWIEPRASRMSGFATILEAVQNAPAAMRAHLAMSASAATFCSDILAPRSPSAVKELSGALQTKCCVRCHRWQERKSSSAARSPIPHKHSSRPSRHA